MKVDFDASSIPLNVRQWRLEFQFALEGGELATLKEAWGRLTINAASYTSMLASMRPMDADSREILDAMQTMVGDISVWMDDEYLKATGQARFPEGGPPLGAVG